MLREALSHGTCSVAHMLTNVRVGFMASGKDATASTADAATCVGGTLLGAGVAGRGRCMADRHARNLLQSFEKGGSGFVCSQTNALASDTAKQRDGGRSKPRTQALPCPRATCGGGASWQVLSAWGMDCGFTLFCCARVLSTARCPQALGRELHRAHAPVWL